MKWPAIPYEHWVETSETLHALTQLLGKVAVALAYPEPQLQHAALRLTARGWETAPLPAPDGSGTLVVLLDLRTHQAEVEHSGGGVHRFPLAGRPVAAVTRDVLDAIAELSAPIEINTTPQEVSWTVALDQDTEHDRYDPDAVTNYFAAATQAALVLADFRAPYRGRSTPVNAWWGSFDLAVNLFSGVSAEPPSADFIMRNAMDSQEVAVGWWPGDGRYPRAAFYAYAHPAPEGFERGELTPEHARWEPSVGEFVLDWEDVIASADPHAYAVEFGRSAFAHACAACDWQPSLAATLQGDPPPVR